MRAKMVEPLHCCVDLCVFLGIGWNTVGAKMVECLHCCVYLSRFIRIALNPAYAREDSGAIALLRVSLCFLGIGWNTVGAKMVECVHRCVYLSSFICIALNPAYAREDGGAFALLRVSLCFPWHWMESRGREDGGVFALLRVSQQVCQPQRPKSRSSKLSQWCGCLGFIVPTYDHLNHQFVTISHTF